MVNVFFLYFFFFCTFFIFYVNLLKCFAVKSTPYTFLCLRVERLWRDVWTAVTSSYYNVLHSLEEEGLIDLSNAVHLFCVRYVFIPRIHTDLQHFIEMWNCHPLRTEGNLSPNQLWNIGMLQAPVSEPDFAEVCIT